jgi:biotin carboxylase
MKNIIVVQNSVAFSVDFCKILSEFPCKLYLIVNPKSLEKLQERGQAILFEQIYPIENFDFNILLPIMDEILKKVNKQKTNIVTNSERCVALCAQLRDHYGIVGDTFDCAERFTNKLRMKAVLSAANIRLPRHLAFDANTYLQDKELYLQQAIAVLGLPIFAKPIQDANSHSTAKLHHLQELKQWCDAYIVGNFELDEFIEGTLFHCDSLIQRGNIIYTQVCEYTHPCYSFMEQKPLGSITLPEDHPDAIQIREFNQKILKVLGYSNSGATHLELFKKPNGELIFLEVAARAGGGMIPKVYQHHLRLDLFATHFLLQINENYMPRITQGPYACWVWFPLPGGILQLKVTLKQALMYQPVI